MTTASTHFLVLGAGGLGCPALLALLTGGARSLTVVDDDVVDASNLHRQVLYTTADVGMRKVDAARMRLQARAPALDVQVSPRRIDVAGVGDLLDGVPPHTVVLECTDDPGLKFAINDACLARDLPLVVAAVLRWRGQAIAVRRGSPCYRCIYEAPPPAELTPPCSAAGVLGAAAGALGWLMAHMALRMAEDDAGVVGRLIDLDLRDGRARELAPSPRPGCPACAGRASTPPSPPVRACADRP